MGEVRGEDVTRNIHEGETAGRGEFSSVATRGPDSRSRL